MAVVQDEVTSIRKTVKLCSGGEWYEGKQCYSKRRLLPRDNSAMDENSLTEKYGKDGEAVLKLKHSEGKSLLEHKPDVHIDVNDKGGGGGC